MHAEFRNHLQDINAYQVVDQTSQTHNINDIIQANAFVQFTALL